MHAGADPFEVVDTFLEDSAASVVSEQTKAFDKDASAGAVRLAASTLVSLGPFTRLYRHCFGKAGAIDDPEEREMFSSYRGLLKCTQQLRNAAAHNDCLLNGLANHEKKSGAYPQNPHARRGLRDESQRRRPSRVRKGRDGPCRRPHLPRRIRPEGRQPAESRPRPLSAARDRFAKHVPGSTRPTQ